MQPSQAKLSVVTPCLNAGPDLEGCIANVAEQAAEIPLEHIIVDGGSDDDSLAILERASRDHPHLRWSSGPDLGIADAFNRGIRASQAPVVGILNVDDRYQPQACARALDALAASPDLGFVFGGCHYVDATGRTLTSNPGSDHYVRAIDRRMPPVNHPTVFVRREVYQRYGLFRSTLRYAMDHEFLLRIHRAGVRGQRIDAHLAAMRMDGASVRQQFDARWESCVIIATAYGRSLLPSVWTHVFSSIVPAARLLARSCGLRRLGMALMRRPS